MAASRRPLEPLARPPPPLLRSALSPPLCPALDRPSSRNPRPTRSTAARRCVSTRQTRATVLPPVACFLPRPVQRSGSAASGGEPFLSAHLLPQPGLGSTTCYPSPAAPATDREAEEHQLLPTPSSSIAPRSSTALRLSPVSALPLLHVRVQGGHDASRPLSLSPTLVAAAHLRVVCAAAAVLPLLPAGRLPRSVPAGAELPRLSPRVPPAAAVGLPLHCPLPVLLHPAGAAVLHSAPHQRPPRALPPPHGAAPRPPPSGPPLA